jgi:hypothetical protein
MNTINIPGFTAEASLYKRSEGDNFAARWSQQSTDSILPADSCCAPCGKDLCCDECPPSPSNGDGHERRFRVQRFQILM